MSVFFMAIGTLNLDIDIKSGIEGTKNPLVPVGKQDCKPAVIPGFIEQETYEPLEVRFSPFRLLESRILDLDF